MRAGSPFHSTAPHSRRCQLPAGDFAAQNRSTLSETSASLSSRDRHDSDLLTPTMSTGAQSTVTLSPSSFNAQARTLSPSLSSSESAPISQKNVIDRLSM